MDLFKAEQKIYDDAVKRVEEARSGAPFDIEEFAVFIEEYGRILKQLRRTTRMADRVSHSLHASTIDLTDQSNIDPLTGVYNRRYLEKTFESLIKKMSRYNGSITVMMIDIDFFKMYNDAYGHQAGDECIKAVANVLSESAAREGDFVARYGGEEFIVVLPHTDAMYAHLIADRLLDNVRALNIPHGKSGAADRVTISIGITSGVVEHTHKPEEYIKVADGALYEAKKSGRNRYKMRKFDRDVQSGWLDVMP